MVITKDAYCLDGLRFAIKKAKDQQTTVLFSYVQKIDNHDPIAFYHAGRENYKGQCFFWQDPKKEIILAGTGQVTPLSSTGSYDRYIHVEKNWDKLLRQAVSSGESGVIGTGPLLFGGFSFDPEEEKKTLWNDFEDETFAIPCYMLSLIEGQSYLTINRICSPDDNEWHLYKQVENEVEELTDQRKFSVSPSINPLIKQEEIHADAWKTTVASAITNMKHSSLDKVVLARELRLTFENDISPENVLLQLMKEQPDSYIFSLESGDSVFIGATPEKLIKKRKEQVFSDCLAGSIGRGEEEEDRRLGEELLQDRKNLLEHQYVVSMIKDAFDSLCSSVKIPDDGPVLMKNRHIQHLYTPISGVCEEETPVLEFVRRLHPTPAMGGMPKDMAVTKIREWETLERGMYAGPLGWMDAYGNSEFAVGIRSALLKGREASLFAGGGVLEDSTPEKEYKETAIKFNPMLSALGGTMNE
ncbi:isochorismate synthase [Alteribacillus iranensis]|uniref:isochorismate synthase n=1 Tax=Alteribacillus iranensis TaxID=930128 RepID=A0A1I1ZZH2_9BACI|nr:isochorismate synthase [Alteribacillus iranensis]SFE37244.1 isochorismate synthase [Alteribacillus iranensis]